MGLGGVASGVVLEVVSLYSLNLDGVSMAITMVLLCKPALSSTLLKHVSLSSLNVEAYGSSI